MDPALMRRRVGRARVARLGTVTAGGRPHLVPCCFALHEDTVYTAVDAKPKSTAALRRLANVRANPAATLLVDHYVADWSKIWWVRVDGIGRVLDRGAASERALDLLVAKYPQYQRLRPPGAVIAMEITAWRAWP
jgi:PPOX class probable F420-dependent enzyme